MPFIAKRWPRRSGDTRTLLDKLDALWCLSSKQVKYDTRIELTIAARINLLILALKRSMGMAEVLNRYSRGSSFSKSRTQRIGLRFHEEGSLWNMDHRRN